MALSFGDVTLYPLLAELNNGEKHVSLRNRELKLLEIFFNSPEIIFSKEQLTDRLFSISEEVSENAIEVYVGRARKKLIGSNVIIETVRSMGYRLKKCLIFNSLNLNLLFETGSCFNWSSYFCDLIEHIFSCETSSRSGCDCNTGWFT